MERLREPQLRESFLPEPLAKVVGGSLGQGVEGVVEGSVREGRE